MKKIIAFALVCVLALAALAGCGNNAGGATEASATGATEAEVTLLGVSTDFVPDDETAYTVTVPKLLSDGSDDTTTVGASDGVTDDAYPTFTVIYKTQTVLYFTINLSNPKNYYILDFKLSCDEDDGVTVKQGRHQSRINDPSTYIRWDEASDRVGNRQATFELTLPDPEISPTSIRISEMYYSDRTDGTNKTSVNMNDRDVYTVYKTDSLVETVSRRNSLEYFEFGLNVNEKATVTGVKVDGVEQTANGEGKYQIPSGKLVIEYDFETSDGRTYKGSYEEDIEVLRFERTDDTMKVYYGDAHFYLYYKFFGTDFSYENLIVKDYTIEVLQQFPDGINIGLAEYPSVEQYRPNLTLIICGTEFVVADTFE